MGLLWKSTPSSRQDARRRSGDGRRKVSLETISPLSISNDIIFNLPLISQPKLRIKETASQSIYYIPLL